VSFVGPLGAVLITFLSGDKSGKFQKSSAWGDPSFTARRVLIAIRSPSNS
jgi:hypothetical protein